MARSLKNATLLVVVIIDSIGASTGIPANCEMDSTSFKWRFAPPAAMLPIYISGGACISIVQTVILIFKCYM